MPPPEVADLHAWAVLWPPGSWDRFGQLRTSDVPEELRVRWTFGGSLARGAGGGSESFDATVVSPRRLELGAIMWPGRVEDLRGTNFDEADEPLLEVVRETVTRDVKGRATRFEYGLNRFRGALPDSESVPP